MHQAVNPKICQGVRLAGPWALKDGIEIHLIHRIARRKYRNHVASEPPQLNVTDSLVHEILLSFRQPARDEDGPNILSSKVQLGFYRRQLFDRIQCFPIVAGSQNRGGFSMAAEAQADQLLFWEIWITSGPHLSLWAQWPIFPTKTFTDIY